MTKKDKKAKGPKMSTITTKSGESLKVFEDLHDFETYLKGETEDQEFDHVHCQLKYYPPFVLHDAHDDPEKIKETANSHSKKFVRHLHQHVEKHLLKDIKTAINKPELKFHDKKKQESFDRIVWNYGEEAELNAKKFKVSVEVVCKHDGAMVDVDYRTEPLQPLI
ncbi:CRB_1a_G0028580.mRNA.1.CDS.1 [Saccharomyces cerevisiae]|nr:CRB_1a_G0028580.mRNA.1.CDS.1 [Saccharomyces cerevisiae]CAI7242087.1 CRB_1a_G0028580.mRNA.1.CDS.1 [Saccharomyces cerevisiae]